MSTDIVNLGSVGEEALSKFKNLVSSASITVVLFSTKWAEQCNQIRDVFQSMLKNDDFKGFKFVDCDADQFTELSDEYNIELVPTTLILSSGKVVDRVDGIKVAELTAKCRQAYLITATAGMSLNDRLKNLINKAKVMIFMKGDRNTPRCGFSKQLIAIINDTGVSYETFDILSDEEVRQGLKEYSEWPTYPQLYVKGELVGGLDIIKSLVSTNEFASVLNG